jgi:hypothetical protein
VEIHYQAPSKGLVTHLVIDSTGFKVYGEGECKMRKYGKEKRRVCRKLHLAMDHSIVAAESSLENIADKEVLPTRLNRLRRKREQVCGDGAWSFSLRKMGYYKRLEPCIKL